MGRPATVQPDEFFHRVVCINLDERADRWAQMQETADRLPQGVTIERFSAIKPSLAAAGVHNARAGVLLSHRRVIEQALHEGVETVLVFEDDARLCPDFEQHIARTMASLHRKPWDIFYLGMTAKAPLVPAAPGLVRTFGALGAHAIAYHRRAMPKLLKRLPDESSVIPFLSRYKSFDRFYWQRLAPVMCCFAASPPLAFQRDDYSDIENRATDSHEHECRTAFAKHLSEPASPVHHAMLHASLAWNRLGYAIDSQRRAWLSPIKAK